MATFNELYINVFGDDKVTNQDIKLGRLISYIASYEESMTRHYLYLLEKDNDIQSIDDDIKTTFREIKSIKAKTLYKNVDTENFINVFTEIQSFAINTRVLNKKLSELKQRRIEREQVIKNSLNIFHPLIITVDKVIALYKIDRDSIDS